MMAANSRGLELLGVTADSADRIENVWIEKDPAGEPTGRLTGSVITYYGYDAYGDELMNRLVPHFKFDVLLPSVRDGIERYKRLGITAVYENHMLEDEMLEVYRQLRRDDDLAMRVVTSQEAEAYGFAWASQPREEADFRERLERAASKLELDDDLLRFNGVTVAWDGYCYGGTMMMREPYLDVYGKLTHGHRHISLERAEHLMRFCAERGMRLNILAMGLKAHDEVLELLERLDPEIDVAAQNWVLCHATTIENEQIDRFKALGFAHTTSMAFGCGEGDLMCRTMGRHVLENLHPLRHFSTSRCRSARAPTGDRCRRGRRSSCPSPTSSWSPGTATRARTSASRALRRWRYSRATQPRCCSGPGSARSSPATSPT